MAEQVISPSNSQRMALQGLPQRLIQDGLMDEKAMLEAVAAAKENGANLVSYLVAKGMAQSREIAIAGSQEFGVPIFDLDAFSPDLDTIKLVSDKLLQKHRVLPLLKRGKRLFVAISDPTNMHALDEIKFQTGLSVEAIVVEDDKLEKLAGKAIEQVDTQMPNLSDDDLDLDNLDVSGGEDELGEAVGRDEVEDAPIVRFVNKVLLDAIKRGASDIHFEPYEKTYRIRLRLDGYLKELANPPVQLGVKLAARIKVMSRLDIAERRVPQDGRIKMRISKTRAIDFRVSTCPTLFGEKIVARILDPSSAMLGIDALGYEPAQKDMYMNALSKPHGMILVTGPTGSGKTVSLYTGLNILNKEDTNISTAEDPAEINLVGVNQVNVNPKVGLTFAGALRAFLRQDPDVIMVGEIRDLETAEIAIKAAQTGHLVLSTLHTNDAPKTLTRLIDMGVKPYAIATSVSLIIAQRLARRLCNNCKTQVELPPEAALKEGFTEEDIGSKLMIYRAVGCSSCTDGYKGRTGLYQVMPISEEMGRIILRDGNAVDIAD
ncbi:MAG TPA: type IV-A pilus assembly ATPase PilB, partial [Steroidobacteraceae bacterium]|nr:type IV-A pilus assembly ATPase PilB [Steroidobacteraceae bacterium]